MSGGSSDEASEAHFVYDELDMLRARSDLMEAQLREFKARIAMDAPHRGGGLKVVANEAACCSCGQCLEACPIDALSMDDAIRVDGEKCIGCGVCIDTCPSGALSLQRTKSEPAALRSGR